MNAKFLLVITVLAVILAIIHAMDQTGDALHDREYIVKSYFIGIELLSILRSVY